MRGLDMGINDYVMRPVDRHELLARVRTQIRRKRYSDFLRNQLRESVEMSITDPLTGLHNRRYMERHLKTLIDRRYAHRAGRCRSWSPTSITSSASTTPTATMPAISSSRNLPTVSGAIRAGSISLAGSAARSS